MSGRIHFNRSIFNAGVTYNIEQHQRNTRLLGGQSVGIVHQFLHHRQLSDQLCHLLWHVQAVSGNVQRAIHQGLGADKQKTRSWWQFPLLVSKRAKDVYQRIAFVNCQRLLENLLRFQSKQ